MSRVLYKETVATVDLSTVTHATWTEAGRFATASLEVGKYAMLRVTTTGTAGGTTCDVRTKPAWGATETAVTEVMQIFEADDSALLTNGVLPITDNSEHIVGVIWGALLQQQFAMLPPFIVVEVQEDRTSGTLILEGLVVG